jgi:hypothetical protein
MKELLTSKRKHGSLFPFGPLEASPKSPCNIPLSHPPSLQVFNRFPKYFQYCCNLFSDPGPLRYMSWDVMIKQAPEWLHLELSTCVFGEMS